MIFRGLVWNLTVRRSTCWFNELFLQHLHNAQDHSHKILQVLLSLRILHKFCSVIKVLILFSIFLQVCYT